MLLRQEVREPALYNSVLDAIGAGNTTPQRIAEHSGVNPNSVAKYLKSLVALGIVERDAPFGENARTSRKAIYQEPFERIGNGGTWGKRHQDRMRGGPLRLTHRAALNWRTGPHAIARR